MGGSGSSSRWSPTSPRDPCTTLAFRANLNSPQPSVLASVTVGTILQIQLSQPPQIAVLAMHAGLPAGSITGSSAPNLINCLRNGYNFEAEVLVIVGGSCTVEVRAV